MKNRILIFAINLLVTTIIAQQKGTTPFVSHSSDLKSYSTYAVIVGISAYQDKDIPDLRFADKDAEAFANYLRSNAGQHVQDFLIPFNIEC